MKPLHLAAPVVFTALWCAMVALGLALAALAATEPPVWDALSYVQKGYTFWESIKTGQPFNPFDLPMTIRPPGTILMSYPFGWSDDFHWFYFRSVFIPIGLLVTAVYIAGWSDHLTRTGHWMLAGLALSLAGMPMLYQFEANEALPQASAWGLVDGFLAGVGAIAAAATLRSVASRSIGWALIAAAAAGFSFWIKPSGLVLMALTGTAWLILVGVSIGGKAAEFRRDAALKRFVVLSLAGAVAIYALAVGVAFRSEYFTADNIAFGRRAQAILDSEFVSQMAAGMVLLLIRTSFGYVVCALIMLGLALGAGNLLGRGPALAALTCLAGGLLFWLGETAVSQARYFVPFGVMAFVLLTPPLLSWAQNLNPPIALAGAAAAMAPTMIITALLISPSQPEPWQQALGINLHVNDYQAENEQAANLMQTLRAKGVKSATVYLNGTTTALRNMEAVWDHGIVSHAALPNISAYIPIDWQRPSTVRMEDLLRCDFIAVEPILTSAARDAILARREITDFASLIELINAWIPGLDAADGVAVVSETRVRLVRITDRVNFEAAIARLEEGHDLPEAYRNANPQRWWSAAELAARGPAPKGNIAFHRTAEPTAIVWLRAAEVTQASDGLRAAFWLESVAPDILDDRWLIFAHLIGGGGEIVANAQIDLIPGTRRTSERAIRHYTVSYPNRPKGAVALAFGIYKPGSTDQEYLFADQGASDSSTRDWGGRRVILPLPASQ